MSRLLANMKTNLNESQFKQIVLRVIAEQLPRDSKQVDAVEQAFRCLDRNGDGVLKIDEVTQGLASYPEFDIASIDVLFKQLDRDKSGTINVQEFVTATMDQRRTTSIENLWHPSTPSTRITAEALISARSTRSCERSRA